MEVSEQQWHRAHGWTGTLTEAAVILGMPWRRCWAYVSGHPVSIKPFLKSKKAKAEMPKGARKAIRKGGYSIIDLQKLKLADLLLSAGLSGKSVQELIDGKLFEAVGNLPEGERLTGAVTMIEDGVNPLLVQSFAHADFQQLITAVTTAHAMGARCVTVRIGYILDEVVNRIVCHQECREYVVKTRSEVAKALAEAFTEIREKKISQAKE